MCKPMARPQQRMPRRRRRKRRKRWKSQPPNLPHLKRTLKPRLLLKTTERACLLSLPVPKQLVKRLSNQRQVLRTAVRVSLTIRPLHQNPNPSRTALPKSHAKKSHRLRMTPRDPKALLQYSRFRLHLNYLAQPQKSHYRLHNAERAPQILLPHPHHPAKPELLLRHLKQQLSPPQLQFSLSRRRWIKRPRISQRAPTQRPVK